MNNYDMDEIEIPVLESLDGSETESIKPAEKVSVPQYSQNFYEPDFSQQNYSTQSRQSFFDAAYNDEKRHNLESGAKIVKILSILMVVSLVISVLINFSFRTFTSAAVRLIIVKRFYDGSFRARIFLGVTNILAMLAYFFLASKLDMFAVYGYSSTSIGILQFIYVLFGLIEGVFAYFILLDKRVRTYFN